MTLDINEDDHGRTVREVLKRRLGISRRLLVKLKTAEQGIALNGRRAWVNEIVAAGDRIELRLPREQSHDLLPEPMELSIVFEDEHLLVVNKPAGLIVHPTLGHYKGTLANGIVHYWRQRGEIARFHPVHRLDEHTSGLVVIAKHAYAHQQLAEQMARGEFGKHYRAYVYGCPPHLSGKVDAPIGRSDEDPHRRIVRPDGAPSVTLYSVKTKYACGAAALDIQLETGRTHQIRVHMLHIGCPLIGDDYYADPARQMPELAREVNLVIKRQALHASRLVFRHPLNGNWLQLDAELPDDLHKLEGVLQSWQKEN
jgi:23S rRNA pseudouridine1911/1915/1917 synthase